ncbi:MAG: 50S ribosomal protein L3 [Bacteriovoracales bacterium]|nr:50S ribosomal protein L3 [Bacteriovoracales bacterium]
MTEEKLEDSGEDKDKAKEEGTQVSLPVCYGVKAGMTRVFDEIGNHVPVTVIKLIPNFISRVRKREKDGLEAYQIAYGEKREILITKPVKGILRQAGIDSMLSRFSEFKVSEAALENLGKRVFCDFEKGSDVDVCGVSKGKGFQGVVKKFGHRGGPKSHGSKFHRTTGSIGNRATPGRVWKNKKMPGAMGAETKTVQNLKVVELNRKDGYLLVRGPVPGSKNNFLRVEAAVKGT